jgi:hypothetical protein
MSVAVASFDAIISRDRRANPVGRAGLRLVRNLLLATVAIATTGVIVIGVTLAAGWVLSTALPLGPSNRAPAKAGLRRIALAPPQPDIAKGPGPADIMVFPVFADAGEPAPVVRHTPSHVNRIELPPPVPAALLSLRKSEQQIASVPSLRPTAPQTPTPRRREPAPPAVVAENRTAIYDISARAVYLPNGKTLEAHSGLGDWRDNPRYIGMKMRGPTPPNTYDLSLRGSLFHGVRAIRLSPVDDEKMFGRAGMLAHTYMLGPEGDSNGCVSFKNYPAFLQAYLKGEIDRLVVVPQHGEALARPGRGHRSTRYAINEQ